MKFNFTLLITLFLPISLLLGCADRHWPSLSSLYRDRLASQLVKNKKTEDAFNLYLKNLEENAWSPSLHSNLGILLDENQKPEEALKSLLAAKDLADQQNSEDLKFATRFNLGVHLGNKKKISEALQAYQQALEINPSSTEVKHNIELLIQQQEKDQNKDQQKKQDQKQDQDQKNESGKDQQQQQQKDQNKDQQQKDDTDQNKDQKSDKNKQMQSTPKYKPRPYQGDQLSEGDVKKILGELRNQEQKIRANFDKKERKDKKNEKDW